MTIAIRTAKALRDHAATAPDADLPEAAFRSGFEALLAEAPAGLIRDHRFFSLPANQPPWLDTGIDCVEGESLTLFATGRACLSREAGVYLDAALWLWFRIGEAGEAISGTRASHSFAAPCAGRLYLAGAFPGEWSTPTGDLDDVSLYAGLEDGVAVLVIRWTGSADGSITMLAERGDVGGLLAGEIARQRADIAVPEGWFYPWHIGPADAFATDAVPSGRGIIGCYSRRSATTLRKAISLPFTPGTRLRWAWKMDSLPSEKREDSLFTHDYLSLAVEFDNGRDIAYQWSAELPGDTAYACPIPKWANRETHVVLRSGTDGLGAWFDEDRDLYADYLRFIGDPPARIICVWFIALSLFQGGEGQCEYGPIELVQGDGITIVN